MIQALLFAMALALGLVVGFVFHEIAHYVVLRAAGYDPSFSLWPPVVDGLDMPRPVPWEVRLAAVAPAWLGLVVTVVGGAASLFEPLLFPVVVGAVIRLVWLSPEDRDIAFEGMIRTQ